MKKFVMIESIGHWENKNGKTVIYGTVENVRIAAESNNPAELKAPAKTEYRADGTWHSYSVELRKYARRIVKA